MPSAFAEHIGMMGGAPNKQHRRVMATAESDKLCVRERERERDAERK